MQIWDNIAPRKTGNYMNTIKVKVKKRIGIVPNGKKNR